MEKVSGETRSRLYLFQLKNVNVTRLHIAKADAMLLLQTIPICQYKGKMAELCPKTLKIIYYHMQYDTVIISSLPKLKKLFQVIIAPLVIMLLLLGSSMLIAISGKSQLLSENAGASALSLSPTSSANQSGTIGSLQASEVVSFEGQQSNQSFVNQTTISRLREATDESFEAFQIPTTNENISGPTNMSSQAFLSTNNISASDSQNVQNTSDSLPPSIGNTTDEFQREEQAEGGGVYGNITTLTPPTPGTMIESHKIDVVPLELRDIVGETSVASNDNDLIFYTGNWYAARSFDAGRTWEYINAYEDFEDFCCDQRVIYDPTHNLFIWYRQGDVVDNSTKENRVRIGFSNDTLTWTMFDIIPSSVDDYFVEKEFDYPEIATTDNYLYMTTNALPPEEEEEEEDEMTAVIIRISLDRVIDRGIIDWESYWSANTYTFTPVQGAKDKMYWATHLTNDMMRIYEWDDHLPSTSIRIYDREIDPWFILEKGVGECVPPVTSTFGEFEPEGNWCERSDSRITSGWISGTQIGFFWNADAHSRSALGATFPWPYINAATFDTNNNMSYIGRPYIWHNDFPWLFASAAVNENGGVGVVAYYGQPNAVNIPGVAFGVRNQPDKAEAWNMTTLAISGAPPEDVEHCEEDVEGFLDEEQCELPELLTFSYEWGDYITIRSREGPGLDWDAAAYVLEDEGDGDSDTVMPYYFRISNTPRTAS